MRIQEIADKVGVSRTTVYNVIHGRTKKISTETIQKISDLLTEAGYTPNAPTESTPRIFAEKASKIIGIVEGYITTHGIPALRDPYVGEILSCIVEYSQQAGYYVMLIGGSDIGRAAEIASRWNIDGLIVWGYSDESFRTLCRQVNKYTITIDAYPEAEYHCVNVGLDDYAGGELIAGHMLKYGHPNALFAAETDAGCDHQRWLGFQHGMEIGGIRCDESRHIVLSSVANIRQKEYAQYLPRFLEAGAVSFAADYTAFEAINYMKDHGINVPEQVSVTGFDDNIYAEFSRPQLTTVRQNVPKKAQMAVDLLLKQIRQEPVEFDNKSPVELISRSSVKKMQALR